MEISAGLSKQQNRAFGFKLGALMLGFALVLMWRDNPLLAKFLAAIGVALLLMAIAWPKSLGAVEKYWMLLGHQLGRLTSPIITFVIYFAILTPFGFIARQFGAELIGLNKHSYSYWKSVEKNGSDLNKQF